jgi:hypothetical protein
LRHNFRFSTWTWGAALAFVSVISCGQTPAPVLVAPAYNAAIQDAILVCTSIPSIYTSMGPRMKGGDLPFRFGIAPVVGAPYSAVGITDSVTTFTDGNRITRHETTRFFRDGHGRTRIEHTATPSGIAALVYPVFAITLINDPVSGECYVLDTPHKISHVLSHPPGKDVIRPPFALGLPLARLMLPGLDFSQGAAFALTATFGAPEAGSQMSLPEKTIDNIRVVGARVKHRIAAGEFGNEQPIFVTVEDWFSPDLGVTVRDTQHTSIGGETDFRLEQVTRSEPDPALFQVPPGYARKLETHTLRAVVGRVQDPVAVQVAKPHLPPPVRFAPAPCPQLGTSVGPTPSPSSPGQSGDPLRVGQCFKAIPPSEHREDDAGSR